MSVNEPPAFRYLLILFLNKPGGYSEVATVCPTQSDSIAWNALLIPIVNHLTAERWLIANSF